MLSAEDLSSVYQFMKSTGENNLRKMMIEPKGMTQPYFNFLMKVLRTCNEAQFIEFATNATFPKMKLNADEIAMKETFWNVCFQKFKAQGLVTEQKIAA